MHTANCNHSFCESCIKQWLNKSKNCPTCRTQVNTTVNSLAVDNFITNLCSLIGGTIKEQHDELIRESKNYFEVYYFKMFYNIM